MFEVLIGVIYLEFDRDLEQIYYWLVENFIVEVVNLFLIIVFKDDLDLEIDV